MLCFRLGSKRALLVPIFVALIAHVGCTPTPTEVRVPGIVGLSREAAEQAILASGLVPGTVTMQFSDSVPAGEIIRQSPPLGAPVAPNSPVDLVVSLGPEPLRVPDVLGATQLAAETRIALAGLTVGRITSAFSETVPAGMVVFQHPPVGFEATPNSPVDFILSKGPEPVLVPSVVGMTQAEAAAEIDGARLVLGAIFDSFHDVIPAGHVVQQTPRAGDRVPPGSPVSLTLSIGSAPVDVPDVMGLTLEAATNVLESAGLRVGSITEAYSEAVATGLVISQSPVSGTVSPFGTEVWLVVSVGPAPVSVPDVVGMTQSEGEDTLAAAGLQTGQITEIHAEITPGEIMEQAPVAGTKVPPGTAIDLVVSIGPRTVTVPKVVGLSRADAILALLVAELRQGVVTEEYNDTVPTGQVIRQAPAPDVIVAPGSPVDFVVSRGPEVVTVPGVIGLLQSAAESALASAGLSLGTASIVYDEKLPFGTVVGQQPAANSIVQIQSPVDLTVARGRAPGSSMTVMLPGGLPLDFVWIPQGSFVMGRNYREQDSDYHEDPQRNVTFASGFWMSQYELTKAQWISVMQTEPWEAERWVNYDPESPAQYVSWNDAKGFLSVSKYLTGIAMRLPTESEWEYACRAGTRTRFYWGDDPDYTDIDAYCWWEGNKTDDAEGYPRAVGLKIPNAWNLHDMSGNMHEWCEDEHHRDLGLVPSDGGVSIPTTPTGSKVIRGGSWASFNHNARSAYRAGYRYIERTSWAGIRLVLPETASEGEGEGEDEVEPIATDSVLLPGDIPLDLVFVPAGSFSMGSPPDELGGNTGERPQHEVTISSDFWMGKFEVTKAQWFAVMGTKPWEPSIFDVDSDTLDYGASPIEGLLWEEARDFVTALNTLTGMHFRLPTEAEWEYAYRAATSTRFYWGDDPDYAAAPRFAIFRTNRDGRFAHAVGTKLPNPWGLYDMAGNALEWCSDWYGDYIPATVADPIGPFIGTTHVARGGSWNGDQSAMRAAKRYHFFSAGLAGMRLVREIDDNGSEGEPEELETRNVSISDDLEITLIRIPAGNFLMGADPAQPGTIFPQELPQHEVTLTSDFWMSATEITKAQWTSVTGSAPWEYYSDEVLDSLSPASHVSWIDAQNFCQDLANITVNTVRLPTEAEWEYAYRAGTTTRFYWGSDEAEMEIHDYAWTRWNTTLIDDDYPHRVGQLLPNSFGLYDMAGGVKEWCLDVLGDYPDEPVVDPTGPFGITHRVARGGSWQGYAGECRASARSSLPLDAIYSSMGFRVVFELNDPGEDEGEGEWTPVPNELVAVGGGTFPMGENRFNNGPEHEVTVSPYGIGTHEVTCSEFSDVLNWANMRGHVDLTSTEYPRAYDRRVVRVGKSWSNLVWDGWRFYPKTRDGYDMDHFPVVSVTWFGAVAYCNWLSERHGLEPCYDTATWQCDFSKNGYHLPTEAQWEYAAKWTGSQAFLYGNGSNQIDCDSANLSLISPCNPFGFASIPYLTPVGYYEGATSPVGCFDMSGNAYEWCNDWYEADYYGVSPAVDPTGPETGKYRTQRGGNFHGGPDKCSTTWRSYDSPEVGFTGSSSGFRIAR